MSTSRKFMKGFSLIELIVAMAVLAILMVAAIPAIGEMIANSRIRSVSESLVSGMQFARAEAVRRNERIRFSLDSSAGNWTVMRSATNTCQFGTAVSDVLQSRATTSSSTSIVVTTYSDVAATTTTTAQIYIYNPGGARATECADQFVSLSIDSSALSAADSRDLRIVAPRVGRARLCDPHVSAGDTRACPTS